MSASNRIALLDNRLANQIAAGEVVERPASVVKELLENSIDAGATRIEVDIERGGARLIRITDNGHGIHKDDLPLALTRHATSKIRNSDDLANIHSLGFRGEALASISSVSHLTLTSRQSESELAWQAVAHGREMAVEILPAAAAPGTRIEIADLFYNTPARQKFLRAEKTEFNHIEAVFKSHALTNFDVSFILKHDHKLVKRLPAIGEVSQKLKRIAAICGQSFCDNALSFECQHEFVRLWGWLGRTDFHRSESDIQYIFVNGRPVRDKTLNHAVRQAYDGLIPAGRMATYVIYMEIDAQFVDVNVHPTKHEVRFSQQRLVHDLMAKSVNDTLSAEENRGMPDVNHFSSLGNESNTALSGKPESALAQTIEEPQRASESYSRSWSGTGATQHWQARSPQNTQFSKTSYRPIRSLETPENNSSMHSNIFAAGDNFFISQINGQVVAVRADRLLRDYVELLILDKLKTKQQSLLFPYRMTLPLAILEDFSCHQFIQRLGFDFQPFNETQIEIRQLPEWLASLDSQTIFNVLPEWISLAMREKETSLIAEKIVKVFSTIPLELTALLLKEMNSVEPPVDSDDWLRTLDALTLVGLFP